MTEEKKPLTITELSNVIKFVVEGHFEHVRVQGEISGLKLAASGHVYFSLKDNDSVINAIAWKGTKLPAELADGLEVICSGRVTTFAGNSRYQIIVSTMETAGVGALLKLLEELKAKLLNEGIFDEKHKQKIPFLPQTIGVVTSPTGAVIRDIIHRIADRFPARIIVYPVTVQGEGAGAQIAKAITNFNTSSTIPRPDIIIVARGGGSLEDLWCFNEEQVVRSVFESKIPIISAVGHETDTTLIDYVADLRAPTPTGAAEKAVPVREDLIATVDAMNARLSYALAKFMENKGQRLLIVAKGLPDLSSVINNFWQKLDFIAESIEQKIKNIMMIKENKFNMASRILETCSYKNILEKGFVLVRDANKNPVTSAKNIKTSALELQFHDGNINVEATAITTKTKIKKYVKPPAQGSFF